jgi:hypothetical protein
LVARGPIETLASDVQQHTHPASSSSNKEVHSSLLVEDEQHVEAAVLVTSTSHINAQPSPDIDHPLMSEETRTDDSEYCDREGTSLQASDVTQEPDLYSSEA